MGFFYQIHLKKCFKEGRIFFLKGLKHVVSSVYSVHNDKMFQLFFIHIYRAVPRGVGEMRVDRAPRLWEFQDHGGH